MFKKLYILILLGTITFTMSCSYSGKEDPGDTFRVLAASKEWYEVVLGGAVTADISSGELYGSDGLRKLIIGYYVESPEYTKAIYANGFNEESRTYFNYFGVELILDENDNQQAVDMEFYYNDGEFFYDKSDVKFTKENKATFLKGFDPTETEIISTDKYVTGTGLSITSTESSTLYSVATIKNSDDNDTFIKGYVVLDNGTLIREEIMKDASTPTNLKTTGYHSIAPFGDNATLTYIKEDEKVEVFEINKDLVNGRTLTGDIGLGINAVYSTIATNKDQDIFVAYVDKGDKLSMFKKAKSSADTVASFIDYFNGVKIENVSKPIIKIFDNGTMITSYIDNSSKLLKIIVDDFTDSTSPNYITIVPPTNLTVTSFSVDIIEDTLHYIYSTPISAEVSVYEDNLWRVIKTFAMYSNVDFVSIAGVNKKELYYTFHFKGESEQCNGSDSNTPNCTITIIESTDYGSLFGFQSHEGEIGASPNIGSFATQKSSVYYLFNSTVGLRMTKSTTYAFWPRGISTSDGLPVTTQDSSDIDMFELVSNQTDINNISDQSNDSDIGNRNIIDINLDTDIR